MNKKLLFTLLLTGTTSVGHATDEARLLRFPATNGQEVVFSYAGDLYKAPLKAEKHNASLRISAMKCLPVSRPMANLSPSPDNMTEIRKCI